MGAHDTPDRIVCGDARWCPNGALRHGAGGAHTFRRSTDQAGTRALEIVGCVGWEESIEGVWISVKRGVRGAPKSTACVVAIDSCVTISNVLFGYFLFKEKVTLFVFV